MRILFVICVFFALSVPAIAQDAHSDKFACEVYARVARISMTLRQAGLSPDEALEFSRDALKDMPEEEAKNFKTVFAVLLKKAYQEPIASDDKKQQKAIENFSSEIKTICLE